MVDFWCNKSYNKLNMSSKEEVIKQLAGVVPEEVCKRCAGMGKPGVIVCALQNEASHIDRPHFVLGEPYKTIAELLGICPNNEIVQLVGKLLNWDQRN